MLQYLKHLSFRNDIIPDYICIPKIGKGTMNNFGITDKSYQLLQDTFTRFPEVEQVVLFGSRAKGNFKKGSDIDLSVKGPKCNPAIAMKISAELNEELPIPFWQTSFWS
jgi:predicted nucleotidyltransferase